MTRAGSAISTWRSGPNVLAIYLNDHLAGATAGAELARRAAGSAQDHEAAGLPVAVSCAFVRRRVGGRCTLWVRGDLRLRSASAPPGTWQDAGNCPSGPWR